MLRQSSSISLGNIPELFNILLAVGCFESLCDVNGVLSMKHLISSRFNSKLREL